MNDCPYYTWNRSWRANCGLGSVRIAYEDMVMLTAEGSRISRSPGGTYFSPFLNSRWKLMWLEAIS